MSTPAQHPSPHHPGPTTAQRPQAGDLNPQLVETDIWTDQMVGHAGIPVLDVPFVTVGGGIGSFVTTDYLRIYGVPATSIAVLTGLDTPWQSYEYLTRVSQIPRTERLRSDSASCPDNIWGFPSYAVREAFSATSLSGFVDPLWNVLTEPILRDYYTPRAGHAFSSMEQEAHRIGYFRSVHKGQVRMVRRRAGGGYYTILTPPAGASRTKRVAFRSRFVHLAVGYPGLKLLPDLQAYRETHRDPTRVVNAYEPHEHVYRSLAAKPGTVVVRGGGVVASRVLQRLIDDRDAKGLQTQIVQIFRTFYAGPHGKNVFNRRPGADGWAYQGFNYPKSVWGGQLKAKMAKLHGHQRAQAYEDMGGTNTPKRRSWMRQQARGRREGWYRVLQGKVTGLTPAPHGQGVITAMQTTAGPIEQYADFVIDCTGLEADIRESRVLADLLDHSGAGRNPKGRLDVAQSFEVLGTRNEPGRLYASGTATLGGPFPGVDTFLGLQIAAQEIADDLAAAGFCQKLGPGRSTVQWWRWARNKPIEDSP